MKALMTRLAEALGLPATCLKVEGIGSMLYISISLDQPYNVSMVGLMVEVIREFKLTAAQITISYGAMVMAHVKIDKDNHTVNEYYNV